MRNDDVIQSIRHILDINDRDIAHILKLRGYKPTREEVAEIFATQNIPEEEKGKDCSDILMAHFLDGLIYYKRGKSKDHPPRPIKTPVTNNMILKKMRVAFNLHEKDMHEILALGDFSISKHEMSALFRRENHENYRECGDQILRYFLKGLAKRARN